VASAKQYGQQIKNLGLELMEIKVSSLSEMKRNVNLEMKTIRSAYRERMSTAASTSAGIVTLFGKRKLAGQLRADEKRRLSRERDKALRPYENVKLTIDDLLVQMDSAKTKLEPNVVRQWENLTNSVVSVVERYSERP